MEINYIIRYNVLHISHLDHAELGTCACLVMNRKWELNKYIFHGNNRLCLLIRKLALWAVIIY